MRVFRYLIFFECFLITAIFLFFREEADNQQVFEFFKSLFPEDSWVISTKYYQASKITSSLTSFFIVINTIYLLAWGYLNYDKPTEDYDLYKFYERGIKNLIYMTVPAFIVLYMSYTDPFVLLPYRTSSHLPIDSLFSVITLSLMNLVCMTIMLASLIVGMVGFVCRFFMIFK